MDKRDEKNIDGRTESTGAPPPGEIDQKAPGEGGGTAHQNKHCDLTFEAAVAKWTNGKLSSRPGFYAGRGPQICDLNSSILEDLWQGILNEIGTEAAQNFILMVESLEDMSATAFLVNFQRYWHDRYRWNGQQRPGDGNTLSGRGAALEMEAMFAVMSALTDRRDQNGRNSDSRRIKEPFLINHGHGRRTSQRDEWGWGYPG